MKRLICGLMIAAAGCSAPTAPTQEPMRVIAAPQHDGIPFSFKGDEGHIYQLCATQPREYIAENGQHVVQEDHYAQKDPCPAVPVQ
jgi:hypothetical protein